MQGQGVGVGQAGGRGRGRGAWQRGQRHPRAVRQVGHQLPHLLQSVGLHQDVVLGKQQSGNFTQFADRGRVGIGNDGSQIVHSVVKIMHSTSFPGIYRQPLGLKRYLLEVLQILEN